MAERFVAPHLPDADDIMGATISLWRTQTPQVVAAYVAANMGYLPGVTIELSRSGTPVDHEDRSDHLMSWQMRIWLGLMMEWSDEYPTTTTTLEEDLATYVDQMPAIRGASAGIHQTTQSLLQAPRSAVFQYKQRAILASIRARHGLPHRDTGDLDEGWAVAYFSFELGIRLASEEAGSISAEATQISISEDRARRTLTPRGALVALASIVQPLVRSGETGELARFGPHLESIAKKVGKSVGLDDVFLHFEIAVPIGHLAEKLIEIVPDFKRTNSVHSLLRLGRPLVDHGRVDDIKRVTAKVLEGECTPEARAEALAWLCESLIALDHLKEGLDRIDSLPEGWERAASPATQLILLLARSRALRMTQRPRDALSLLDAATSLLAQVPDGRPGFEIERAIALRENGAPDIALRVLLELDESSGGHGPAKLYETLGNNYMELGRPDEALAAYGKRISIDRAHGRELADPTAKIHFLYAWTGSRNALPADLPSWLPDYDPYVYPGAAVLEAITLARLEDLVPEIQTRQQSLLQAMPRVADEARRRGNSFVHINALRALALASPPTVLAQRWLAVENAYANYQMSPDEQTLINLANVDFTLGNYAQGADRLPMIAEAIARRALYSKDLAASAGVATPFAGEAQLLLSFLLKTGELSGSKLRLATEVTRDAGGRSLLLGRRDRDVRSVANDLREEIGDESLATLGPLVVLERIFAHPDPIILVTSVNRRGQITSKRASHLPIALGGLKAKLAQKLASWTRRRVGDPFDLADWQAFETWLGEVLGEHEGHVVVIDSTSDGSLPWHVAVMAHGYTCSYANGWLDLTRSNHTKRTEAKTFGAIAVPRQGDPLEVQTALDRTVDHISAAAFQAGLEALVAAGCVADLAAFRRIMESADVVAWVAHGFIDSETGDVGIMIANEGRLPFAHSVATNSPAGHSHRVSWRNLATLERAPAVVLSSACSSGLAHIQGLGDRLGIYSQLRHLGTRTFIAPQWDIDIASLAVYADIVQRIVVQKVPPHSAVFGAAQTALRAGAARWIACPFGLEGSWSR